MSASALPGCGRRRGRVRSAAVSSGRRPRAFSVVGASARICPVAMVAGRGVSLLEAVRKHQGRESEERKRSRREGKSRSEAQRRRRQGEGKENDESGGKLAPSLPSSSRADSGDAGTDASGGTKEGAEKRQRQVGTRAFYGAGWKSKLVGKHVPCSLYAFFKSCWEARDNNKGSASLWGDPFRTFTRQAPMFKWADEQRSAPSSPGAVAPPNGGRRIPSSSSSGDGGGDGGGEPLRYFSFERKYAGCSAEREHKNQRVFLCTTLRRFWRHYSVSAKGARHYYELIREGCPCKVSPASSCQAKPSQSHTHTHTHTGREREEVCVCMCVC